jgi:hypothetical protein
MRIDGDHRRDRRGKTLLVEALPVARRRADLPSRTCSRHAEGASSAVTARSTCWQESSWPTAGRAYIDAPGDCGRAERGGQRLGRPARPTHPPEPLAPSTQRPRFDERPRARRGRRRALRMARRRADSVAISTPRRRWRACPLADLLRVSRRDDAAEITVRARTTPRDEEAMLS